MQNILQYILQYIRKENIVESSSYKLKPHAPQTQGGKAETNLSLETNIEKRPRG